MTGLNTKTEVTHDKLDTIIGLLGNVVELLGGAPPEETITLADVVAELVAIKTILGDVHLDTISIDQKLLAIRNYIKNPAEEPLEDDYTSLLYNVMWIRRAIAATTFAGSLDYPMQLELRSFRLNNDTLISTTNNILVNVILETLVGAFTNLGIPMGAYPDYTYNGWLDQIRDQLEQIYISEGTKGDGGNQNIIQLLYKIAMRPESQIGSGLVPNEVCIDAYVSTGMILVPGVADPYWPNLVYAKFGTAPPPGIEYGSIFGIGTDYTELVSTAGDWDGFWIYVASSTDNFGTYTGINTDDSLARYPTNVWVSLMGYDQNLAVFVPGDASVKVYICGGGWAPSTSSGGPWGDGWDTGPPPEECITVDSIVANQTDPVAGDFVNNAIILPDVTTSTTLFSSTFSEPVINVGDFFGYTALITSGAAAFIFVNTDNNAEHTTQITLNTSLHTEITVHTASILIYNRASSGAAPFSIEWCPPGIEP